MSERVDLNHKLIPAPIISAALVVALSLVTANMGVAGFTSVDDPTVQSSQDTANHPAGSGTRDRHSLESQLAGQVEVNREIKVTVLDPKTGTERVIERYLAQSDLFPTIKINSSKSDSANRLIEVRGGNSGYPRDIYIVGPANTFTPLHNLQLACSSYCDFRVSNLNDGKGDIRTENPYQPSHPTPSGLVTLTYLDQDRDEIKTEQIASAPPGIGYRGDSGFTITPDGIQIKNAYRIGSNGNIQKVFSSPVTEMLGGKGSNNLAAIVVEDRSVEFKFP